MRRRKLRSGALRFDRSRRAILDNERCPPPRRRPTRRLYSGEETTKEDSTGATLTFPSTALLLGLPQPGFPHSPVPSPAPAPAYRELPENPRVPPVAVPRRTATAHSPTRPPVDGGRAYKAH